MSKETRHRQKGPVGGFGGPGGPGGMAPGEKAKDFRKAMKGLGGYLARYKFRIFLVILFAIGSTIFNIVGPKISGKATTEIFNGLLRKVRGTGGIDFDAILKIMITLIILYGVAMVFSLIQGFIMTGISQKVTYELRKEISKKINRMPMKYFDTKTHGEVLSRVTNDVDTLSQSLNQSITQTITSVTMIIGVIVMMLSISGWMTLVAVLTLPVSMLIITKVIKKSQRYFVQQQEYLGHVNGQVEEIYGGHNVVKVFNGEEEAIKEFNKANEKLFESAWKSQFLSGMMMPIMQFVGNIGYVGVAILGGYLTIKDRVSVGDIQAFIQYVRSFNQPISQLAQISNQVQSTAAAAERVFEFLNEEEEDQTVDNGVSFQGLEGKVEFKNAHYGYYPD